MAKKKIEANKQTVKIVGLPVPIKFYISDQIITRFASNMTIQIVENEFKISFFEMKPDIILSPSESVPKEVRADCVASVIVTANKLPKFIEALQTQMDNYKSIKKEGN
jgi:hypothetical protein